MLVLLPLCLFQAATQRKFVAFLLLMLQEALVGLKEEKELEGSSRQRDVGGEGERAGGSGEGGVR